MQQAPRPRPEGDRDLHRFVERRVDPQSTLDLLVGRSTVLQLKQAPRRFQLPDDKVVSADLVTPKQLSLTAKAPGAAVLNLWFPDKKNPKKDFLLSYLVRVSLPQSRDPREDQRMFQVQCLKELEHQVSCAFPDSMVYLNLVGERLVLSGQAKDRPEANAIARLIQAGLQSHCPHPPVCPAGGPCAPLERPCLENLLRVPGEQQVLLRVTVAEVDRTAARSVGVNFLAFNRSGVPVFGNLTGNIAGNLAPNLSGNGVGLTPITTNPGSANNLPVSLDNGRVIAAINALRNLDFARSLAEPTLVAIDGQTARFQAGGTFPVPVTAGTTLTGLQGVQFVPFGVELEFTPSISDKDRVRLCVRANVSTRNVQTGTLIAGTSFVPGTNTRNFQTTVELRQGQTMAVAGLIQNDFNADAARVPLLGDLPLIGRLAAFDRTTAGEQELVILVTPELVHPLEARECPPLPGADLFEPSDVEFYLLGRLESCRPYDYRSPAMTDLARMARYRHCEQLFIFGPQGHSDGQ
jgi:pilus assembly protein CpaC